LAQGLKWAHDGRVAEINVKGTMGGEYSKVASFIDQKILSII